MGHEYKSDFYEYINAGSLASARVVCPLVVDWLRPNSLLDVGSGAGAWCRVWLESGVPDVLGIDGDYVDRSSLLVAPERFRSFDLSRPVDLGRRFDVVTSLEVAEHVPEAQSSVFVDNLTRHGDVVLFSAAVPGQGGEFHVNEQPLDYWRALFATRGYRCFDPLRARLTKNSRVEPWYRYNTLLYVSESRADRLADEIRASEVRPSDSIAEVAPWSWRARNAVLRKTPAKVRDQLVHLKHWAMRRAR